MSHAIVVGGGIVGCACAYFLSREHIRCTVIEPGAIGGEATAAGMGHVVAMDDSEEQFALTRYSQQLWDEIYPELPPTCEVRKTGTLWVAADDEELAHARFKESYLKERGVAGECLDEKALAEAEPNLRKGLPGALLVPGDSVIYPMAAAQWLIERSGAQVLRSKAHTIGQKGVTTSEGKVLEADFVINATGGHAPTLTPGLPIEPRKGHLLITDRYPNFVNRQIIELGYIKSAHSSDAESVAFNVQPRATGQLLIGSSRQFVGWDRSIDRSIVRKMVDRALQYMPGLSELSTIRIWAGFRAATSTKLPIICRWHDGTFVAAGHEGLGITTCMATGQLIADIVTGGPSAIDRSCFGVLESLGA